MVDLECVEGRLGGSCSDVPDLVKGPLEDSVAATVVSGDGVATLDWASILSGQSLAFYPHSPPLGVFQRTANNLWGREGSVEIRFLAPSVYFINFPSRRVRDWVLESGPLHILQKTIILRKWLPGMNYETVSLDSAPIWVKLWHIPLELYSQQGLGYLASALGKPLYTDKATALKQHLEYAKICVEVSTAFLLPNSIIVDIGDGNCFEIGVELDWGPPRCSKCVLFGNSDDKCRREVLSQVEHVVGVSKDVVVPSQHVISSTIDGNIGENADVIGVVSNKQVNDDVTGHELDMLRQVNDDIVADVVGVNKFVALCDVVEQDGAIRPVRVTAGGVADLIERLKPKGKRGKKKGKGRGVGKDMGLKDGASPDVLCLLETRVQAVNAYGIIQEAGGYWVFLSGYYLLFEEGEECLFCSFVYACNGREDRRDLWRELVAVKACVGVAPWLVAGDFNIFSRPQESSDYNGSQGITCVMKDFFECQELLDVVDHPFGGSFFTWCNCREENPLSRKLDKVLVNQSWFSAFPSAAVNFLGPDCSDHCPSHLVLKGLIHKPPRPFKFFGFWVDHPDFFKVVEESWGLSVVGNHLFRLFVKLKRVMEKRIELGNVQQMLLANPSTDNIKLEKEIRKELRVLERAEEKKFNKNLGPNLLKRETRILLISLGVLP
ncbi:hypothetical protein GQ457_04G010390 [Hibiscus cannabinus]